MLRCTSAQELVHCTVVGVGFTTLPLGPIQFNFWAIMVRFIVKQGFGGIMRLSRLRSLRSYGLGEMSGGSL